LKRAEVERAIVLQERIAVRNTHGFKVATILSTRERLKGSKVDLWARVQYLRPSNNGKAEAEVPIRLLATVQDALGSVA
jgi:hypothetical protein